MSESTGFSGGLLDGNAAAGALRDFFAVELTAALGQCDGCGHRAVLAEARLYTDAPGLVARIREASPHALAGVGLLGFRRSRRA